MIFPKSAKSETALQSSAAGSSKNLMAVYAALPLNCARCGERLVYVTTEARLTDHVWTIRELLVA